MAFLFRKPLPMLRLVGLVAALTVATATGSAWDQAAAEPLKIGVTPGAYADSVAAAAQEAKAKGLDVQVVEFSD